MFPQNRREPVVHRLVVEHPERPWQDLVGWGERRVETGAYRHNDAIADRDCWDPSIDRRQERLVGYRDFLSGL